MKKHIAMAAVVCAGLLACNTAYAANASHRLGIGANYWKTLKDLDLSEFDNHGISWLATYQYSPGTLLSLEADAEIFRKGYVGAAENIYAPQAYVLIGSSLYAGLGIGIYYLDGEFADSPFYALRAGVNLELIPSLYLDINANYRFEQWKNISAMADEEGTDTITLGAALRFAF